MNDRNQDLHARFQKVRTDNDTWLRERRKTRLKPLLPAPKEGNTPLPLKGSWGEPEDSDKWETVLMQALVSSSCGGQCTNPMPLKELSPASQQQQSEWWKFEAILPPIELLERGIESFYQHFGRLPNPHPVCISLKNIKLLDLAGAIEPDMWYSHPRGRVKLYAEPWSDLYRISCKIS